MLKAILRDGFFCYFCSVKPLFKSGTSVFLALLFVSWGWIPVLVENSHHHDEEYCNESHAPLSDSCHISIFHPSSNIQHCEHKQHLLPQKFHCKIDFQFHKIHIWSLPSPNIQIYFQTVSWFSDDATFLSEAPAETSLFQPSNRGPPNKSVYRFC